MSCALVATREAEISGAARKKKIGTHFAACALIKLPVGEPRAAVI